MDKSYQSANTDLSRKLISRKVDHTAKVIVAGLDICAGEKDINWNMEQVEVTCFLHDIGRFPQSLLGSFSDGQTKFDHAKVGADMFAKKFKDNFDFAMSFDEIFEAIDEHSRKNYAGNNPYVKLIRDADKLANIRVDQDPSISDPEMPKGKVTPEVLQDFLERRIVDSKNIKVVADYYICFLSWIFDYNFKQSLNIISQEKIHENILDIIKNEDKELALQLATVLSE